MNERAYYTDHFKRWPEQLPTRHRPGVAVAVGMIRNRLQSGSRAGRVRVVIGAVAQVAAAECGVDIESGADEGIWLDGAMASSASGKVRNIFSRPRYSMKRD